MNFSFNFDKLNIPMYICSSDWNVIYRNTACKKYTKTPRMNGDMSKCFIDREGTNFPLKDGECVFVSCFLGDSYKTALCFEYHDRAAILFPALLEFDLLFSDVFGKTDEKLAGVFRAVLDVIAFSDGLTEDKYCFFEKLRKYIYSAIENYVSISFLDSEKRVLGSLLQIYGFFSKRILSVVKKSGNKVEADLSGIRDFGDTIYTDTTYFTMVLSGILLFCLSLSSDRMCKIVPEHLGTSVRHLIRFTCRSPQLRGKKGTDLGDLMKLAPIEYLNVMMCDELCSALGWRLSYSITEEKELNARIYVDIDNDNSLIFRSVGNARVVTPEDIITDIIFNTFLM